MAIKGINLIWIIVSDIEKSEKFFTQTLGLKVKSSSKEHGWLELIGNEGGTILGVGQAHAKNCCGDEEKCSPQEEGCCGGKQGPGDNAIVTLDTDDIVQTKKDLEAKKVEFISEIEEVPGHVKLAMFVDPDGNLFQIVQKL